MEWSKLSHTCEITETKCVCKINESPATHFDVYDKLDTGGYKKYAEFSTDAEAKARAEFDTRVDKMITRVNEMVLDWETELKVLTNITVLTGQMGTLDFSEVNRLSNCISGAKKMLTDLGDI